MKLKLLIIVPLCWGLYSYAQSAVNTWSVKFSDAIIGRYQPTINTMTNKGWEYSNGIILVGMEKVFEKVPANTAYLNYIQTYVDTYVNSSGALASSKIMTTLGLDGSHPGLLCLFLYQQTGLNKYKLAAKAIRDTLIISTLGYPRTPEGGYWHRNDAVNFKNVELLDGIYMAEPFLAKYGAVFNDNAATDTAVDETIILYNRLYSNTTKLVKHAYDYDLNTYAWAVPATGISTEVWSRGMGWFVMSIIEILRYLPHSHPKYGTLITMLNNLAAGIKNYQDPTSKLWLDIVDSSAAASQNYVETSGSAMFIYSLKTAVDSGWISSATYLPVANAAWTSYQTYITTHTGSINGYAGGPQINSFTPAMGVQNNYAAYVSNRPVNSPTASGTQHPHGYAATLMAASAMEFPLSVLPVTFRRFSIAEKDNNLIFHWENEDDYQVSSFIVQKIDANNNYSTLGLIVSNGTGIYDLESNNNLPRGKTVFFRVKATLRSGETFYSETLSFTSNNRDGGGSMAISPNPVTNGLMHIRMNHLPAGIYYLSLVNISGQTVRSEMIHYSGGYFEYSLLIPPTMKKGIYNASIKGIGNFLNQKFQVQ